MLGRHLVVALVFVALAVAMTWPLARVLDRAVADPGDPFINTWILDWDYYATLHQPLSLFHANAFYPAKWSLALSENLYGIALVLMPFRLAGVTPIQAHNLALILGFAFSGFGAFVLGRTMTGSYLAGVVAGVFFAFVPFRFTHLVHVQHIWGGWLPLLPAALIGYSRRPTWRSAALFGAALLFNGLSNIHWLLFGTLAVALTMPVVVRRREDWLPIATAAAVAGLLLVPFLYPYAAVSKLYGMTRTADEAMRFSATPGDWLIARPGARVQEAPTDLTVDPERWLWPGALSIVLAAAGAVAARRERTQVGMAALWVALGFLGSLGLHTFFHRFLFDWIAPFRSIRVPARWASIAYVGLAMLIAMAVARAPRRPAVSVVLAALFVLELRAAPIRWYLASPDPAPFAAWLAGGQRTIIELPIGVQELEYATMLTATVHHRPMANGVSGFAPPEWKRLADLFLQGPAGGALVDELRRIGVDTVVVHADALAERNAAVRAWLRDELALGRLRFVRRFSRGPHGDWVFSLRDGVRSTPDLERFLAGGFTPGDGTIGLVETPAGDQVTGPPFVIAGWALSPWGVRSVDLLFENGRVRVPARLEPYPELESTLPFYPATRRPRFTAELHSRPGGVKRATDLQVEIVDGRGAKTVLEGRFLEWP